MGTEFRHCSKKILQESNYRSHDFIKFFADQFYTVEEAPSWNKHAGGIAKRTVGLLTEKTIIALLTAIPPVPDKYWELAMTYAANTLGCNFSTVVGTSPYYYITGSKASLKYLRPFWSKCYVYLPLEFRQGTLGCRRAQNARFVCYENTTILFPIFLITEILDGGIYGKPQSSKDVIFDNSTEYQTNIDNEEPYDREFQHPDTYIPYAMRMNFPEKFEGPDAIIPLTEEIVTDRIPKRTILASRNLVRNKLKSAKKLMMIKSPLGRPEIFTSLLKQMVILMIRGKFVIVRQTITIINQMTNMAH